MNKAQSAAEVPAMLSLADIHTAARYESIHVIRAQPVSVDRMFSRTKPAVTIGASHTVQRFLAEISFVRGMAGKSC